ncbi:MAG: hypothetical protein M3540_04985 [Actinomycetota bacterium]|nr:hypothetical protein [Actinomycetota bacterium]
MLRDILGLLGIAVFIVCVISLAAAITWTVVRITPNRKAEKEPSEPAETA